MFFLPHDVYLDCLRKLCAGDQNMQNLWKSEKQMEQLVLKPNSLSIFERNSGKPVHDLSTLQEFGEIASNWFRMMQNFGSPVTRQQHYAWFLHPSNENSLICFDTKQHCIIGMLHRDKMRK